MYMVWLRAWCWYHTGIARSKYGRLCLRTNVVKSYISVEAWMNTNTTPSASITSGTCLCSKESARLDLYPLSPRLPSCRREGRESQGERLWVLCTEPDLQPSEWRNHCARADSPRQEVHLWQMMQVNRLNSHVMIQAVNCDLSPRRLRFDIRAVCGGQSGIGTGVLNRELRHSQANYYSTNAPRSFIALPRDGQ